MVRLGFDTAIQVVAFYVEKAGTMQSAYTGHAPRFSTAPWTFPT
jgi:hypothetical protein